MHVVDTPPVKHPRAAQPGSILAQSMPQAWPWLTTVAPSHGTMAPPHTPVYRCLVAQRFQSGVHGFICGGVAGLLLRSERH